MISIVMAAHNEEAALPDTLDSILAQTYDEWELVVLDDGSSDGTSQVIASYAARDARVRCETNARNIGLTLSLNVGLDQAKGDWIARIDAGDTWAPDKLEKQMAYVDTHPDVGLLGTCFTAVNVQTGEAHVQRRPVAQEEILEAIWRTCPFTHSTILFQKALTDTYGGYDPAYRYAQDLDLYFRLVFHTESHNLPESLCRRTTHGADAIGMKHWKEQVRCVLAIRWKYLRLHRRPLCTYLRLAPDALKLVLPSRTKLWKQALMRGGRSSTGGGGTP